MSFEGAAISLGATVISLAFASLVLAQWLGRRRPYQLAWSLGLGLYAIAAFTQFLAEAYGWSVTLWIGIGALIIAAGGSLARFNISWALYVGELVGIAVMFEGFLRSQDLAKVARPSPAQTAS